RAEGELLAVDVAAEGLDAGAGEVELGLADVRAEVLDLGVLLRMAAQLEEELAMEVLEAFADGLDERALLDAAFPGGGGQPGDSFALEVLGHAAVLADALQLEAVGRRAPLEVAAVALVGEDLLLELPHVEVEVLARVAGAGIVADPLHDRFLGH